MDFRTVLPAVILAAALVAGFPVPVVQAQDATSAVLAERAELDKALAADATTRIGLLEKFLRDHPASLLAEQAREALVRSHATVGESEIRDGDPKGASEAFRRALDAAGTKISDRLFSSVIWQMPVVLASAGYRADAIDLMKSFEPTFDEQPARLIQIGYFYVSIESPVDAVRVLERATELAPSDHRAFNSLGTAYIINLRLDDAANAFEKAIDLDPREEFAYASLANLRRAFGNPADAIALYKKQLEIKPDDPESFAGLAVAYLLADDDVAANEALARALALSPRDFRLYTTLGYVYAARGRFDKAREMVDLALRIEPRFAWTHIARGNILLGQRRYAEAIEAFSEAQSYGDFPTMHFELAKAFMVNDQFSQAIDRLNASVDITDDGQFETRLGDIFDLRSSKLELLLERERQAVMFVPVQPTTATQFRLAEALARIGHYMELIPDPPTANPPSTPAERPAEAPPDGKQEFLSVPGSSPGQSGPYADLEPSFAEPLPIIAQNPPPDAGQAPVTVDPTLTPADAPLVFRPRRVKPASTEPATAAAEPAVRSEPAPTATEPVASEPVVTEPATSEPAAAAGDMPAATPDSGTTPPPSTEPEPSAANPEPAPATTEPAAEPVAAPADRQVDLASSLPDLRPSERQPELTPDTASAGATGAEPGPAAAEPSTPPSSEPAADATAGAGIAPEPAAAEPTVQPATTEPSARGDEPPSAPSSEPATVPASEPSGEPAARTVDPTAVPPTSPFGATAPASRPEPPAVRIVEDPASEPPKPTAPAARPANPDAEPVDSGDVPANPVSPVPDTLETAPRVIPAPEPEPFNPSGRTIDPVVRERLLAAIDSFVGVDDGREPFRKIWIARQLADKSVLLDRAKEIAEQALAGVDAATELDRSVRDMPDADRETRRTVMTARANDAIGWVLVKRREYDQAVVFLTKATESPLADSDYSTRLWHLGVAKQEMGSEREALDLLIRAYQPSSSSASEKRKAIQALYVRVFGSEAGLDARLKR